MHAKFFGAIGVSLFFICFFLSLPDTKADDAPASSHIPADYTGKPLKGKPLAIPGEIHAVDYDTAPNAAAGITFSYKGTPTQTNIRPTPDSIGLARIGDDHVSISGQPESPGHAYVGWTQPDEWLKYTVHVAEAGTYVIGGKFAAGDKGATLTFSFTPQLTTGPLEIPTTAGFQPGVEVYHVWEKLDHLGEITLPPGTYVMTVRIGKIAGLNLESFTFTKKP